MIMSNYLEIDSKILEKNLLLKKNCSEVEDLESFLRSPENYLKDNSPWKLVTPTPDQKETEKPSKRLRPTLGSCVKDGFCVKTTDSKNEKVFINVCRLDDLPQPRDVSEAELLELWQSDDVPDFRIPLSIQEPHEESDKAGKPAIAYDVALNTNFFQKVLSNEIFRAFVMQVILEGLENKYNTELKKEGYVILQNRKNVGELKPHRIKKSRLSAPWKPLIEEVNSTTALSSSVRPKNGSRKSPVFRLFENTRENVLVGEFHMPNVVTPKNVALDVGENRIVVDGLPYSYFADFFIPLQINEAKTTATFNATNKILTVKMPIKTISSIS